MISGESVCVPTFDSRVVLFDEMALDEPHRQSGLAHSYRQERKRQGRDPNPSVLCPLNPRIGREWEGGWGRTLTTATDENELVFA